MLHFAAGRARDLGVCVAGFYLGIIMSLAVVTIYNKTFKVQ
jgi:hypothetical protein